MYRSILIPTDGTAITAKAVASGIALAKALGARLSTITVKEPFPYSAISEMQPIPPQEFYDAQERIALNRVKEVVAEADRAGLDCQAFTVEAQHPWEAIVDHAEGAVLRPHRDGLARPARRQRAAAGQRDDAGAGALRGAGAGREVDIRLN